MGRVTNHIRCHVVGYLALFVALCGTAYAVDGPLPGQNQVGSGDIINNDLRTEDIRDSNVTTTDIRPNAVIGGKVLDDTLGPADIADVETLHARTVALHDEVAGGTSDGEALFAIGSANLFAFCSNQGGGQLSGGIQLGGVDEPGATVIVDGQGGFTDDVFQLVPFDVQFIVITSGSAITGEEASFAILDQTEDSVTGVGAVSLDPANKDCVVSAHAVG